MMVFHQTTTASERSAMFNNLTGWHLIIVLAIVLLLFGAPKLPGLARSLGQSMRIFRSEIKTPLNADASDDMAEAESAVESEPGATSKR